MSRKTWLILVAIVVVVGGLMAVPFFINVSAYQGIIEGRLSESLNRTVKLNDLRLSLFPPSLESQDVHIGDDPSFRRGDFITIQSFRIHVALWPLLRRQVHVTSLEMIAPTVWLVQNTRGQWNFSSLGAKTTSQIPVVTAGVVAPSANETPVNSFDISTLTIKDGRVIVLDQAHPKDSSSYAVLDFHAEQISTSAAFPFSLTISTTDRKEPVTLEGHAGPLNMSDAAASPCSGTLSAKTLHIGKLKVENLQGQYTLARQILKVNPMAFDLYSGHEAGAATIDFQHPTTTFEVTSQMNKVDTNQFLTDYSSSGDLLYGLLNGKMAMKSATGKNVDVLRSLTGHASLDLQKGRFAHLNLGREISSIAKLAGLNFPEGDTTITKMAGDFDIAENWARTNNLEISIPEMDLLCQGGFSFDHELNFNVVATLTPEANQKVGAQTLVGGLLGALSNNSKGIQIPFLVTGTFEKPHFKLDTQRLLNLRGGSKNAPANLQHTFQSIQDLFKKKKQ